LAGVWLASIDWWFTAGLCIVTAAMFKGQVLMVAPVLFLWPVFGGRFGAAIRAVIGFAFGTALLASIWLLPNFAALLWVLSIALATLGWIAIVRRRSWRNRFAWPTWSVLPLFAIVARPLLGSTLDRPAQALLIAFLFTPLVARWTRRLGGWMWTAAMSAGAALVAVGAFGGTWSWMIIGFFFPTYHFSDMSRGASNIAQILQAQYHWSLFQIVFHFTLPGSEKSDAVTMKQLLITIYAITVVLCAIGAAIQTRRRSARAMIGLCAPWILMYTVLPQMHERYLMWGAIAGVMVVGVSLSMTLLQLIIITLASMPIYRSLLERNPPFDLQMLRSIREALTGTPWMLALAAVIYLYAALAPTARPRILNRP
ncbi:MAG: hypothetical protein JO353_02725, partial [Phycisphaerae bacterium]|nr:hypothetical protein [Phycisphaerae bacterium]